MLKKTMFAGAASLAAIMAVAATPAMAQIQIGAAGPMTGEYASFGQQLKEGAGMAVDDINAKGGVLGKKLVLNVGDDACDPKQAVSVANDMASKKVVFVDGHFCSSSSIPASKVYADEGILQITPASTNPALTDKGTWNIFRTCGRDDQQGKVAGDFMAKEFKGRKIAILNDNTAYGKGLADETKKNLNLNGVKETLYEAYVPGEKDYSALVSRLKQANIDVIYIGGYHTETGLIMRQAKEQGMHVTVIGGDALVTKEFWQITGSAGEGAMMTFPSDPRLRPTAAAVVKAFKAKGIDPEGYVLYAYAAVQEWADAANKAGTVDAKKVAAVLRAGTWNTVLGPISYDKKGDVMKSDYVFYIWHDGNYAQM
ncbi:MAG: branched-chain amino acid ABC transporter substrate-binding protein [Rhodospirillales bacterium]|nr:branched-chain amino acid ABC transporter substrate-binding protein [Rhodospirillales bacterium]MDE2199874.1 branched-chain amino acid ABC transporter substrate-binding protein [Rhodospirillales bacterium]MDE2574143.1 branched-chain amino acid ABC transporter substrate-binding protein [Rhodospirillales bacterium]